MPPLPPAQLVQIPQCTLELSPVPQGFVAVEEEDGSLCYSEDSPISLQLQKAAVQLLAIRHGESLSNAQSERLGQPLLYGQSESPLTTRGRHQTELCAERLLVELGGLAWLWRALEDPSGCPVFISSDVERARESAEILKAYLVRKALGMGGGRAAALLDSGLLVLSDRRLRETHFGKFEGRPFRELSLSHPQFVAHWRPADGQATDFRHRFPGGESRADVMRRMSDLLLEVCQRFPGRTVVLVSHGETLLSTRALLGKSPVVDGKIKAETGLIPNAEPFWLWGGTQSQLIWSEACRNRL